MDESGESSTLFQSEDFNTTIKPYYSSNLDSIFSANRLSYFAEFVEHYYTPILCFMGALGNCLSVAVFCFNANQRHLSSSYYLSALAFSDTGFLITVFVFWLETFGSGVDVLSSKFGCPLIMYAGQVTCFLSVWLTVGFTVERFFAVCSPLKRSSICTVSKAKKVIFSLTTFALIAFSYALFIARVEDTSRTVDDNFLQRQHQNPNDNGTTESTTSRSVITPTQSFTFVSKETLASLQSNQEQQPNNGDFTVSFELNRTKSNGCLEDCQHQFVDGVKDDDFFGMVHGIDINRDNRNANDKEVVDESTISFKAMFNSTTLINFNESDNNYGSGKDYTPELRCTVPLKYVTVSIIANYIDTIITLIIPFFLITYFNMRIAVCVWQLKDERSRIVAGTVNNRNKFNQTPTPRQKQPQPSVFGRMVMRRGRTMREENDEVVQVPTNSNRHQFQEQHDGWTCQMCGGSGDGVRGDSSNINVTQQILVPQQSPNLSQQSQVSCPECKSVLSHSTTHNIEDQDVSPNDHSTMARTRNTLNLPSCTNHSSSSSTITNIQTKLLSTPIGVDLNPDEHEVVKLDNHSLASPRLKSLKCLTPTKRGEPIRTVSTCSSSHSSETRVTKMLLLVSSAFLLLNFPSHAIRLLVFFQSFLFGDDIEVMRRLYAAQQLSNVLLFNTNFAVNFLLYCLSGRNFRKSLWNVLFGRCDKKSRRSYANNTTLQKVRFVPKGPRPEEEGEGKNTTQIQLMEVVDQTTFPTSGNKNRNKMANDFESIELETTIAE